MDTVFTIQNISMKLSKKRTSSSAKPFRSTGSLDWLIFGPDIDTDIGIGGLFLT